MNVAQKSRQHFLLLLTFSHMLRYSH